MKMFFNRQENMRTKAKTINAYTHRKLYLKIGNTQLNSPRIFPSEKYSSFPFGTSIVDKYLSYSKVIY
jgi:hypothetical protein